MGHSGGRDNKVAKNCAQQLALILVVFETRVPLPRRFFLASIRLKRKIESANTKYY